jgi:hypothetical protein
MPVISRSTEGYNEGFKDGFEENPEHFRLPKFQWLGFKNQTENYKFNYQQGFSHGQSSRKRYIDEIGRIPRSIKDFNEYQKLLRKIFSDGYSDGFEGKPCRDDNRSVSHEQSYQNGYRAGINAKEEKIAYEHGFKDGYNNQSKSVNKETSTQLYFNKYTSGFHDGKKKNEEETKIKFINGSIPKMAIPETEMEDSIMMIKQEISKGSIEWALYYSEKFYFKLKDLENYNAVINLMGRHSLMKKESLKGIISQP